MVGFFSFCLLFFLIPQSCLARNLTFSLATVGCDLADIKKAI